MEHTDREHNILQFLVQLMAIMRRVGAVRENKVLTKVLGKVLEERNSHNTGGVLPAEKSQADPRWGSSRLA